MFWISRVLALILLAAALPAASQGFPINPVRIVVPFPGGVADTLSRMLAPRMSVRDAGIRAD